MQGVAARQPAMAHAVHHLPAYDQLELALVLLRECGWPELNKPEDFRRTLSPRALGPTPLLDCPPSALECHHP